MRSNRFRRQLLVNRCPDQPQSCTFRVPSLRCLLAGAAAELSCLVRRFVCAGLPDSVPTPPFPEIESSSAADDKWHREPAHVRSCKEQYFARPSSVGCFQVIIKGCISRSASLWTHVKACLQILIQPSSRWQREVMRGTESQRMLAGARCSKLLDPPQQPAHHKCACDRGSEQPSLQQHLHTAHGATPRESAQICVCKGQYAARPTSAGCTSRLQLCLRLRGLQQHLAIDTES